ncbi:hypothetical protein C8Q78DRAFT_1059477 [Trametes maxima]|nr:hypothetical protein C8Q78DRAFT_1059477 [Trametes maxima]
MFSFSTVTVFATLALSAFTSAVPLSGRALPVVGDLSAVTGVTQNLPVVGSLPLPRDDAVKPGLAAIFQQAQAKIAPAAAQIKAVNKQNATVAAISGPANTIKAALTDAATQIHGLAGEPVEVILVAVEGTALLAVHEVAALLAAVIITVFEALGAVLTLLGGAVEPALFELLVAVGALVGTVLAAVLAIVGAVLVDLIVVLVPLLGAVIPFILHLNIALLISLLGL